MPSGQRTWSRRILSHIPIPEGPGRVLHIDYYSATTESVLGEKYILVVVDGFSRLVTFYPTEKYDAKSTATFMMDRCAYSCWPETIISDGGGHFVNAVMKVLLDEFSVTHKVTTAYAPWTNGVVERQNAELTTLLKLMLRDRGMPETKWSAVLPHVASVINNRPSRALGNRTPAQVHHSLPPRTGSRHFMEEFHSPVRLFADSTEYKRGGKVYMKEALEQALSQLADTLSSDRSVMLENRERLVLREQLVAKKQRRMTLNAGVGDLLWVANRWKSPDKIGEKS